QIGKSAYVGENTFCCLTPGGTSTDVGVSTIRCFSLFSTATARNKSRSCDKQPLPRIPDRRKYAQCTSQPSRMSLKRRTPSTRGKSASRFCTALLVSARLQVSGLTPYFRRLYL